MNHHHAMATATTAMPMRHHANNTSMADVMSPKEHDMMNMMHMAFYFGVTNVSILFQDWTVNSSGEMVGACIGVFIVAMLYEGLKLLRESLLRRSMDYRRVATDTDGGRLIGNGISDMTICTSSHWLQTLLHLLQVTVSYALMLIFMTYNAYLAISIILGAGFGYFVFGWKKAVITDINEHCH